MARQEYKDVDKIFRENESYEEYSKFCDKFQKHPVSCSIIITLDLKSDGNIMKFEDISMIISRYHRKKKYIIRLIGSETEFDEFMRENANKTIKNYYTAYYGTVCVVTSVATYIIDSFYNDYLEEGKWVKRSIDGFNYFYSKVLEENEKLEKEKEEASKEKKKVEIQKQYNGNMEQYKEDPRFFFPKFATKAEIKDAIKENNTKDIKTGVPHTLKVSDLISKLSDVLEIYGDIFIGCNGKPSVSTNFGFIQIMHKSIYTGLSKPYPDSERNYYSVASINITNDEDTLIGEHQIIMKAVDELIKGLSESDRSILKKSISSYIDKLSE